MCNQSYPFCCVLLTRRTSPDLHSRCFHQWFIQSICFQTICCLIGFTSYWLYLGAINAHNLSIDKCIIITEVRAAILNFFFNMHWATYFSYVTPNPTNYRRE